jgi:hypothetical protein
MASAASDGMLRTRWFQPGKRRLMEVCPADFSGVAEEDSRPLQVILQHADIDTL